MKILKFIGIGIGLLVLIFVIVGVFAPKHTKTERSILINANSKTVLDYVKSFKETKSWTPWLDADPNVEITLGGIDGEVGSTYAWEGNDDVGAGLQTIKAINDTMVDFDLKFIRPMEADAKAYFTVVNAGESTMLSWSYEMDLDFISSVFMLFVSMDKPFDLGLSRIKTNIENLQGK